MRRIRDAVPGPPTPRGVNLGVKTRFSRVHRLPTPYKTPLHFEYEVSYLILIAKPTFPDSQLKSGKADYNLKPFENYWRNLTEELPDCGTWGEFSIFSLQSTYKRSKNACFTLTVLSGPLWCPLVPVCAGYAISGGEIDEIERDRDLP